MRLRASYTPVFIVTTILLSFTAYADDTRQIEQQLRDQCLHKLLILRGVLPRQFTANRFNGQPPFR